LGALFYMALDLYLLSLLVRVIRASTYRSKVLEEEFVLRAFEGSGRRLLGGDQGQSQRPEAETILFFFPLEPAVLVYSLGVGATSIVLLWSVCHTGLTSGGWALLLPDSPSSIFWMEIFMYAVSAPLALLAAASIVARRQLDFSLGSEESSSDDLLVAKRCAGLMLTFFVACAFRFSLCVPVTGMALATQDTCGLYLFGLQTTSLDKRMLRAGTPLQCTASEAGILLVALITLLLDAALIVGVLSLWQRYRVGGDVISKSHALFGKGYSVDAAAADPPYAVAMASAY